MEPTPEHREMCVERLAQMLPELKAFGYQALQAQAMTGMLNHLRALNPQDPQRRKQLDELPAEIATVWREEARSRLALKQFEAAGEAYSKSGEVLASCPQPLPRWLQEPMQKCHGQAGLAFHQAAQAATQAGDKAKAAHSMLRAAQCFAASPLPLNDWQAELRDKNPARAALLWHELSKQAQAAGQLERQADMMLLCAAAYRASVGPLKDWVVDLRDKNPVRAGALLMELAKAAEQQGRLADSATLRLKTAQAYRAATHPLADWQEEQRDNNPARAGYLHHQLVEAAKKKGDKTAQAEHLAASADAFALSTVPLKPWQIEARDGNHLKAGKLMGAVADECQTAVRGEKLADLYFMAASYYEAAPIQGSNAQVNTMGEMCLKAADLYRQTNRYKVDYLFAKEISCFLA